MSGNATDRREWKIIYSVVVFLLFIVASVHTSLAQRSADDPVYRESQMVDPHRLPGKLLVEGHNTIPTGPFGLLTYQLEEVTLPTPMEYYIRKEKQLLQKLFRLNITGELLRSDFIIWINDKALKHIAHMGLKKISVFIIDRSTLEDGAVLAVAPANKEYERFPLPERLELPNVLKATTPLSPFVGAGLGITLRSTSMVTNEGLQPNVEIIAHSPVRRFPVMNSFIYLHIGKYEFSGGIASDGSSAGFRLTQKEFIQLKDGDLLIVNYESGVPDWESRGGPEVWDFGPLNKSLLDK